MSLFQCENCGCVENTALSAQGFQLRLGIFDWTENEKLKGKRLCSACGPDKFSDGKPTKFGKWHEKFSRTFLPIGMFKTGDNGNLEHIETGDSKYLNYEIKAETN